jgi:selenocysteine-specific elongation factor
VTDAPLTLGTAGHIDHGKTALVRALTGVDTDRLPEERARGISIELGYAPLRLPSGRRLSVVDVPGHERFVRTMVAGATGIDLVLLVVACDDGVMPQTREHVAICRLLGIPTAVVALTKRDAVDEETAGLARLDVEELLAETPYAGAAIVETSARDGRGLDELAAALDAAARDLAARPAKGPARLVVDRAFSLRGIGGIVTGTLWSGAIAVGDRLSLEPGSEEVRVRSVEVHDTAVELAEAGQRVAASLVGLRRPARRGESLVTPGAFPSSYRLDATVQALADGPGLATGALVRVLHGTADVEGRVVLLAGDVLPPGASAPAQLRLRERLVAARGDRLVLRSTAPPATVAGGVVLDPAPARHGASEELLARLDLLAHGEPDDIVLAGLRAPRWPQPLAALAPPGLVETAAAQVALEGLTRTGTVVALGGEPATWLLRERYDALRSELGSLLAARADEHPLEPALPLGSLVPDVTGREALVAALAADRVLVREGPLVRSPRARADAATVHAAASTALLEALTEGGFTPPDLPALEAASQLSPREFAALCAALEREGRIVRFGGDMAYTAERFAAARDVAVAACEEHGEATLAGLRDALGASRRFAQGILERLDSDGVTRRVGDRRVLRRRGRGAA